MYGQTISMYKTLVDAYRTVLGRMREHNLVLPMTMIMALCGGAMAQQASAASYIWNGKGTYNAWDNNTVDWVDTSGGVQIWPDTPGANDAQFTAAGAVSENNGGTINVASGDSVVIKPTDLLFSCHGYILTGGTITIGDGTSGTITVEGTHKENNRDVPNVATINSVLDGGNSLSKAGSGILVLGGRNTYTGSMHITGGTLQAGVATTIINGSVVNGAFGRNSNIDIDAGAFLFLNGYSNSIGSLAGAGTVNFVNGAAGATLTVNNVGDTTFSGILADGTAGTAPTGVARGMGGLTKVGGGILTLTGNNTYTGATTITAGTLRAGSVTALSESSAFTVGSSAILDLVSNSTVGSLAGSGTVNLGTAGAANLTAGGNDTDTEFSGSLTGTGNLTKAGSGTMVLSGTSAGYSGTTTVNDGALSIANLAAVGNGDLVVTGTIVATTTTSGTPPVTSTSNTYTEGELEFNVDGGGTVSNRITGGTVAYPAPATGTLIMGTVSVSGTGVLVFAGANDYTADTHVRSGTLQAGSATAFGGTGHSDVTVDEGATLDFNGINNTVGSLAGAGTVELGSAVATIANASGNSLTGAINGTGSLVLDSGTQTIAGANTYSGGTTINNGGTLLVGDYSSSVNGSGLGGTLGSGQVTVNSGGVLGFRRNNAVTLSNIITGAGAVEVDMGPLGNLTLSGNSDYTGTTSVNSGRLNVGGTLTSAISVASGAMLGGPGSTTGALTMDSGSYMMGVATNAGAFWAQNGIDVNGALILDTTANGVTGPHTIDVLRGADAHTQFSTSNYRGATLAYDSGRSMNTLTYSSSARTWNAVAAVWDSMTTAAWQENDRLFAAGDSVMFNDTGTGAGGTRTVTVNGPLTPGAINFNNNTSSYIITGPGFIMGASSIVKDGTSSVVWDVNSLYSGTTTINGGTFRVGNGGTRGALGTGDVTVGSGATLLFGRGDTGIEADSITTSTATSTTTIDEGSWVLTSTAVTVANRISGAGNVSQVGGTDNAVLLTGNNDYTGATTVNSGQLWVGSDTALGRAGASAVTVSSGATLHTNGRNISIGSLNGGGMVQMIGTTLTTGADGTSTVFSGQLNDVARDTSVSSSTTAKGIAYFLDSQGNTINYSGQRVSVSTWVFSSTGSTITEGAYLVDSNGSHMIVNGCWVDSSTGTGTAPEDLRVRGTLWQHYTEGGANIWYQVMGAPVQGEGWNSLGAADFVKTGSGTQTLSGDNAYTGATRISGGTLQVGNGGKTGTLGRTDSITIDAGATLAFNRSDNALVWGADSWRNNNLYPGGQGVGNQGIEDTIPIPRGALVISGDISGAGTIRQAGTGTTTLTGDNSNFGGAIVVSSGTLRVGDAIIDTVIDLAHPAYSTFMGSDGETAPHVHQGGQTYAVNGGALGNSSATVQVQGTGTLAFNFGTVDSGFSSFNSSNDYVETHAISGTGNVANVGASAVTLSGASTYTGNTTVGSTVIRYMITGPSSLNNLVKVGNTADVYGQDAVCGAIFKAGVASAYDANGRAVSGAFGVKSVVTVNAGATLDLNGFSNVLGALNSDTTPLTDGNARVREYLPDGEVHAGTDAARLGTMGAAVINYYRNNNRYGDNGNSLAVGLVDLNGATLTVGDGNKSGNYAGVLTGGGSFVKIGTGTQILSGDSDGVGALYYWGSDLDGFSRSTPTAFSGAVQINGGTLQLGDGSRDPFGFSHGSLGSGTVNVAGGATFAFNRVDVMTVVNQISGGGNVRQFGTGITNLSGQNSYTGTTQVDAGTLRAIGTNAFGSPTGAGAAVVNGGTLDLNDNSINFGSLNGGGGIVNLGTNATTTLTVGRFGNTLDTYAGLIQGAGNVAKTGAGTQVLSGANTYTGATVLSGGTLRAGIATTGGTNPTSGAFGVNSAVSMSGGSTLDLNGFAETIGSLSGTAADKVTNSSFSTDAVLTINGTNAPNIPDRVSGVDLNEANFAGSLADTTAANGANGHKLSLVKTGAGTQKLSGNYAYTGDTTANGGTLIFDHQASTPAAIATGNLFLGGATVQFGNLGANTHTFASTTITGNANQLKLSGTDLAAAPTTAGWTTGHVDLGVLTYAAGALDVANLTTNATWIKVAASQGNQSILYNGLVTANGGQNLVATDVNGYLITAVTADYAQGSTLESDGSAVRLIAWGRNGTVGSAAPGTQNGVQNGVISCASGTTDVASILNAYTATGGSSPLNMSNPAISTVTLSIGAGNTLRLAAMGSIVSAAGTDLTIDGGTLTAGGADNTAGTLNINATNNVTITAKIADNGAPVGLNKVGVGTLTIASTGGGAWDLATALAGSAQTVFGGSTHTGTTSVTQGTLKLGTAYALSAGSQLALALGATLDLNNFDARIGSLADGTRNTDGTTAGGTVQLGTRVLTLGEDNQTATFSGAITSGSSSSNSLTKVGTGTQILTGTNTYVGTTSIYQGTLQIGNGGSSGTLGSGFVNVGSGALAGTLAFNRSDNALIVSNIIGGTGNVLQNGTGTTTLSAVNNYQGTTTVAKGILTAGSTSAFGANSATSVASGATLALNGFNNTIGALSGSGAVSLGTGVLTVGGGGGSGSFSGVISGAGGLTKTGAGTQTLSGANGYTGATTVSQGTLALDYTGGSNRVAATSSLVLTGGSLVFQNLGANSQVFSSTQVRLTDPATPVQISQSGWTTGVVDLGVLGNSESGTSLWVGSLDIRDLDATATWIKTSDARYASTFDWSGKASSGGQRVATDSNGYFILVNTTDYSQGGAIGDSVGPTFANTDVIRLISTGYGGNTAGPVTLFAPGITDVGGVINGYSAGSTNPSANTAVALQIGAAQTLRVGSFGLSNSGATTDFNITGGKITSSTTAVGFNAGTRTITVASTIVNNGPAQVGVTQSGGTTVLTGTNTYTGVTTVKGGTLQVGDGATSGSIMQASAITVNTGGTFSSNRSDAVTLNNALSGQGTVAQDGSGTLSLTNAGSFTGRLQANKGVLAVDSASPVALALSGGVGVANGATLRVGANVSASLNGASSNLGTLQVNAGGRLTVAQNISGSGLINNFGTVALAGTTSGAPVTIENAITQNAGSQLTVSGSVVTGTLSFASGSTLAIGADALITVSRAAGAAGPAVDIQDGAQLAVGADTGLANAGQTRLVLSVAPGSGSISGQFTVADDPATSVDNAPAGMHFFAATTGNQVFLGLQRTVSLDSVAGITLQQQETGRGIIDAGQQAVAAQNPDIQSAINQLSGMTGQALADAVNKLTGTDRATIDNVVVRQSHLLGEGLTRWAQYNLGSASEGEGEIARATKGAMRATALGDIQEGVVNEESQGLRVFVRASHVTEDRDQQKNGTLDSSSTGNVFTVGIHNQLSTEWNIGAAFTYDATNIAAGGGLGESDATSYGLDFYASHLMGETQSWFVSGDIGAGVGTYDNKRKNVGPNNLTASSNADATNFHVAGIFGRRVALSKDALLTPYAGASYVNNSVKGYKESLPGAPGLALSYDAKSLQDAEAIVGADFAHGFNLGGGYVLTPGVGAAWHHQLTNNEDAAVNTRFVGASGATFNTYLGTSAKDAIEILGSVTLKTSGGLNASINLRSFRSIGGSNGSVQNSIGASVGYDF